MPTQKSVVESGTYIAPQQSLAASVAVADCTAHSELQSLRPSSALQIAAVTLPPASGCHTPETDIGWPSRPVAVPTATIARRSGSPAPDLLGTSVASFGSSSPDSSSGTDWPRLLPAYSLVRRWRTAGTSARSDPTDSTQAASKSPVPSPRCSDSSDR